MNTENTYMSEKIESVRSSMQSKIQYDTERKELISFLESYINAFDWTLDFANERRIDKNTGEQNDYYEDEYKTLMHRKDIRQRVVIAILDELEYLGSF